MLTGGGELRQANCAIMGRTIALAGAVAVPHNADWSCIMVALLSTLSHSAFDLLSPGVR